MKTIIGTQIGFLIGNVILITLLDFELKTVIENHLVLTFGYFCRYIQERYLLIK
jgi:hypothetical protein